MQELLRAAEGGVVQGAARARPRARPVRSRGLVRAAEAAVAAAALLGPRLPQQRPEPADHGGPDGDPQEDDAEQSARGRAQQPRQRHSPLAAQPHEPNVAARGAPAERAAAAGVRAHAVVAAVVAVAEGRARGVPVRSHNAGEAVGAGEQRCAGLRRAGRVPQHAGGAHRRSSAGAQRRVEERSQRRRPHELGREQRVVVQHHLTGAARPAGHGTAAAPRTTPHRRGNAGHCGAVPT